MDSEPLDFLVSHIKENLADIEKASVSALDPIGAFFLGEKTAYESILRQIAECKRRKERMEKRNSEEWR